MSKIYLASFIANLSSFLGVGEKEVLSFQNPYYDCNIKFHIGNVELYRHGAGYKNYVINSHMQCQYNRNQPVERNRYIVVTENFYRLEYGAGQDLKQSWSETQHSTERGWRLHDSQ